MQKHKIVIINGSPKTTQNSSSGFLAAYGEKHLQSDSFDISRIDIRQSISKGNTEMDYKRMLDADAIIIIFPLYVFCLPAIVMRFLQDYFQYYCANKDKAKNAKIYTIVNCGFPEPDINGEAVRVIECFSKKIGASFRFGILIGGGAILESAKDAPFMKETFLKLDNAYKLMAEEIRGNQSEPAQNISLFIPFPRFLYLFMASKSWVITARKNGLKKKDLYGRPYVS